MTTNLKRMCRATWSFNAAPLVNSLSHSSRALFHTVSSHSSASLPHSYLTVRIDIIRGEPLIFSAPVLEPTDTCTHTLCLPAVTKQISHKSQAGSNAEGPGADTAEPGLTPLWSQHCGPCLLPEPPAPGLQARVPLGAGRHSPHIPRAWRGTARAWAATLSEAEV